MSIFSSKSDESKSIRQLIEDGWKRVSSVKDASNEACDKKGFFAAMSEIISKLRTRIEKCFAKATYTNSSGRHIDWVKLAVFITEAAADLIMVSYTLLLGVVTVDFLIHGAFLAALYFALYTIVYGAITVICAWIIRDSRMNFLSSQERRRGVEELKVAMVRDMVTDVEGFLRGEGE